MTKVCAILSDTLALPEQQAWSSTLGDFSEKRGVPKECKLSAMDDHLSDPQRELPALGLPPTEHLRETATPPRRSLVSRIFQGPNGIRAGWRLVIFIAIYLPSGLVLVINVAGPLINRLNYPSRSMAGTVTEELAGFLAALIASLVMGRIERRSLADYGLPGRGAFGRQFWLGVVWGFLAVSALLVMIHLGHGFDFGGVILSGRKVVGYAVFWGLTFLVVGFAEEYVFRGYPLATLSTGMGFWPSAILLSAAFGAVHIRNSGEDWAGVLAAGSIGLFFCLTLRRTGSLWFAIGMHAAWDYAQSFVYSVPNSGAMVPGHLTNSSFHGPVWLTGGTVGPEGSALVFVVIGALFLIFSFGHRGVEQGSGRGRDSGHPLPPARIRTCAP
jgi:uncharacterized protein